MTPRRRRRHRLPGQSGELGAPHAAYVKDGEHGGVPYGTRTRVRVRAPTRDIGESRLAHQRGDYAAALAAINRSDEAVIVKDYSALLARGLAHQGAGDPHAALRDYDLADQRLAYARGAAHSNIASAQLDLGAIAEALASAEKGVAQMAESGMTRGHWMPLLYRTCALELAGRREDAEASLRELAQAARYDADRTDAMQRALNDANLDTLRERIDVGTVFAHERGE